jgi:hypothetical protein
MLLSILFQRKSYINISYIYAHFIVILLYFLPSKLTTPTLSPNWAATMQEPIIMIICKYFIISVLPSLIGQLHAKTSHL